MEVKPNGPLMVTDCGHGTRHAIAVDQTNVIALCDICFNTLAMSVLKTLWRQGAPLAITKQDEQPIRITSELEREWGEAKNRGNHNRCHCHDHTVNPWKRCLRPCGHQGDCQF